jgi:DNA invertase Pin-like site-specific DNA recombinase
MSDDDEVEVVDVEPVDPRALLARWRSEPDPRDRQIIVQIARECRISKREICRLTGLDRATLRRILKTGY